MKKPDFTRLRKRLLAGALTVLGFSTTFVFMACYGPAPTDNYMEEPFPADTPLEVGDEVVDEAVVDEAADAVMPTDVKAEPASRPKSK